jgi:hypothetical protein
MFPMIPGRDKQWLILTVMIRVNSYIGVVQMLFSGKKVLVELKSR